MNPLVLGKHAHNEMMNVSSGFLRGFITPLVFDALIIGYLATFALTSWYFAHPNFFDKGLRSSKKIFAKRAPVNQMSWGMMGFYALCMMLNLRLWWGASNKWWNHFNIGIMGNLFGVLLGYGSTYLLYETCMALSRPTAKAGLSWNPALPRLLFYLAMTLNLPYLGSFLALVYTAFIGFVQPALDLPHGSRLSAGSKSGDHGQHEESNVKSNIDSGAGASGGGSGGGGATMRSSVKAT